MPGIHPKDYSQYPKTRRKFEISTLHIQPLKMEQIVPKRRNVKIRCRGYTQKLLTISKTRRKFEIKNTGFMSDEGKDVILTLTGNVWRNYIANIRE
jgi:hypothetical protein